jgi:hypothetical protein
MTMEGTLIPTDELFDKLTHGGNITVVVGRRGSGKTAFGFRGVEEARNRQKQAFIVGFPPDAKKFLPGYVEMIDDIKDAPNGAFVMMDEAVLQYNARLWRKGKSIGLLEVIDLARHKDLSVLFLSINTAMLDANILRAIDTLIFKEPSLLQEFMERPFLKKFISKVSGEYAEIPVGDRSAYCYVFDDRFEGMARTELPPFWSDDLSKSWKDYTAISDGETKGIKVIGSASLPLGEAPICFNCQNFVHTDYEAWCNIGQDVGVTECPFFQQKKKPKVWTYKKERAKGKPWHNPPGTQQCDDCTNFCGETEIGMMCEHTSRPVKFIDGNCPYRNPDIEEHRVWRRAMQFYPRFRTQVKGKLVFWDVWLNVAKANGFKILRQEDAGTDVYYFEPEKVEVSLHQTRKRGQEVTKYPMSCRCREWQATRKCQHCNKMAELILKYATDHRISAIDQPFEHFILLPPKDGEERDGEERDRGEQWEITVPCPDCGGTGVVVRGGIPGKCPRCGGTGKILSRPQRELPPEPSPKPSEPSPEPPKKRYRVGDMVKMKGEIYRIIWASEPDAEGNQRLKIELWEG